MSYKSTIMAKPDLTKTQYAMFNSMKERKKFGFQGVPIKTFKAGIKKNFI